jgi:hypothetical protein
MGMTSAARISNIGLIPKKRQSHHPYDESLDDPTNLIADEPVEVEVEIPADETDPVESSEPNKPDSPAFDEG